MKAELLNDSNLLVVTFDDDWRRHLAESKFPDPLVCVDTDEMGAVLAMTFSGPRIDTIIAAAQPRSGYVVLASALRHIANLLHVSDRGHPDAERFLEAHGGRYDEDQRRWLAPGEDR